MGAWSSLRSSEVFGAAAWCWVWSCLRGAIPASLFYCRSMMTVWGGSQGSAPFSESGGKLVLGPPYSAVSHYPALPSQGVSRWGEVGHNFMLALSEPTLMSSQVSCLNADFITQNGALLSVKGMLLTPSLANRSNSIVQANWDTWSFWSSLLPI